MAQYNSKFEWLMSETHYQIYTPMHDLGVLKISSENFQLKIEVETQSSFGFCANSSIQGNETFLDETLFLKRNVKTKILYFIALFL